MHSLDASREAEQKYLDDTLREVHNQLDRLRTSLGQRRDQVIAIRTQMWEEAPHVIHDFDDAVRFTQHKQVLDEQEREFIFYRDMLPRLERMADSPYFGRIDFQEEGRDQSEAFYIGIASLTDSQTGRHLVYDWRAPIASMFYDFEPGPAHFKAAGGTIHGHLLLKRQYKIEGGKLTYLFDTDLKIDDDLLQELLGKSADRRMRAIVQSIQREQNQIIRDEAHRLLVVQGPAGSGKTSIALHRIAYFLYRYRDSMRADHIAILSPNEIFNDYISDVLPELGEENMRQLTLHTLASQLLKRPVESLADQMEYLLASNKSGGQRARVAGIKFKGSFAFLEVLRRYIDQLEVGEGLPLREVTFGTKTVISPEEMLHLLQDTYTYLPYIKRLEKLKRRIQFLLEPVEQKRIEEVMNELENHPNFHRTPRRQLKRRSRAIVKDEMQSVLQMVDELTSFDALSAYRALFEKPELIQELACEHPVPDKAQLEAIAEDTLARLNYDRIGYEDVAPLLYLKLGLGEINPMNDIQHVVIDESQDYSAVHLATIQRLFSGAGYTLLGDLNQAVHPYLHGPPLANVQNAFGQINTQVVRLVRSYRNTKEIAAFSKAVLEVDGINPEPIEPIERSGQKVEVIRASGEYDLTEAISNMISSFKTDGCASIAVICKTAAQSRIVYERLHGKHPATLVTKDDHTFSRGVVVIPSYLAKGLEFDAVIIYDAGKDNYGDDSERKLLYTACTRALHRLVVYYTGEISPLLAEVDPTLYELEEG